MLAPILEPVNANIHPFQARQFKAIISITPKTLIRNDVFKSFNDGRRNTVIEKSNELDVTISGIGGLTLGADPIALASAMASYQANDPSPLKPFVVRKEPKDHGKGKQIEGGFKEGDTVVAIDDVITTGGSTLNAIEAIERSGGHVAFVLVLVDRQEGGKEIIENAGYKVFSLFTRDEFLSKE